MNNLKNIKRYEPKMRRTLDQIINPKKNSEHNQINLRSRYRATG